MCVWRGCGRLPGHSTDLVRTGWGQLVSVPASVQSCPTLCNPMDRSTPGLPVHHNSRSLLKLMCIESVMPSNHLILCILSSAPHSFAKVSKNKQNKFKRQMYRISKHLVTRFQRVEPLTVGGLTVSSTPASHF